MIKWAGIILTAIILFVNAKDMNRLFYRTDISCRQDCRTGEDIISDITHAGIDYHSKPIAFVGMIEQDGLRIALQMYLAHRSFHGMTEIM